MSTTTNIAALRTQLEVYVAQITDALALALANVALDDYIAALTAYGNIVASAASSYNNVAGGVTKREVDAAKTAMDAAWSDFVEACEYGGVIVPSVNSTVGTWRLN